MKSLINYLLLSHLSPNTDHGISSTLDVYNQYVQSCTGQVSTVSDFCLLSFQWCECIFRFYLRCKSATPLVMISNYKAMPHLTQYLIDHKHVNNFQLLSVNQIRKLTSHAWHTGPTTSTWVGIWASRIVIVRIDPAEDLHVQHC